MSLVADAMQPFFVSGLTSLSGRPKASGFPHILTDDPRAAYDVTFDGNCRSISVDFRESLNVIPSLAIDFCRFSSAAFQSVSGVPDGLMDKKAAPWSLIRLYYAAFYAGHAIIRIFGETCTYLERRHVRRLSDMGELAGSPPSFQIDAGLYHFVVPAVATGFTLTRARGSVGGAHESFWNVFGLLLERVARDVIVGPLAPSDARDVYLKLESCSVSMKSNSCNSFNWLSEVRNDLQYRLGYDVWLPMQMEKRSKGIISRAAGQWNRDPMDINIPEPDRLDLSQFVATCVFIVSLCRTLLIRISRLSTAGNRCFLYFGPMGIFQDGEFLWT